MIKEAGTTASFNKKTLQYRIFCDNISDVCKQ